MSGASVVWSYLGREDFKARASISDTVDDAVIDTVLKAVSGKIDKYLSRSFRVVTATKHFTTLSSRVLNLDEDLLEITSFLTDLNADRVYETTVQVTDYDLEPYNAQSLQIPYHTIRTRPLSAQYWPTIRMGIEIAGKWGYWEAYDKVGTLGAALTTTTGVSLTLTAGHSVQALNTILIGTEQILVTAVATNTATVRRGVNGTTASTALNGADVNLMAYPDPVVEATFLWANRVLQRRHSPLGVVGNADVGFVKVSAIDPDVKSLLSEYKKIIIGGF